MDALMGLVILTIILAGAWVGYNAWQADMADPKPHYDDADAHNYAPSPPMLHKQY